MKLEIFELYHLKEMSLSTELFLSCSILQFTFYAISTAYQRTSGFIILNTQVYYISMLLTVLSISKFDNFLYDKLVLVYIGFIILCISILIKLAVTAIPFGGQTIVEWLWGGFTVNAPTLRRFYSSVRRNHTMPEAFTGSFWTRSSLIAKNKLKVCFAPKGARFFSSTRTTAGSGQRTIKTILCDMFLMYQYTICVESKFPSSHFIPLFLLSCIFNSFYYIAVYWISIFYILFTLYISEKFPDSFGSKYLSFLKRNSSTEVFEKYCGNPWGALKAAIKNPEFIKVAAKNGIGKAIVGTGAVLVTEHTLHKAKIGQVYEYKLDQYLNSGKHSSGKPFSFKPNGPSMLEKVINK